MARGLRMKVSRRGLMSVGGFGNVIKRVQWDGAVTVTAPLAVCSKRQINAMIWFFSRHQQ